MPAKVTRCDDSQLCAELSGETSGVAFHALYQGHPESRIVAESDNFALVVDIAPLAYGHTLLVPREHYLSFGAVPTELWAEIELFRDHCIGLVAAHYGQPTILEHGTGSSMRAGACISHAHWHLVPGLRSAIRVFERDGLGGGDVDTWRDLSIAASRDIPYIYYEFGGAGRVYTANLSRRRQYLRIVIAEILGIPEPESDWALTLHPEILRKTVSSLTAGLPEVRRE